MSETEEHLRRVSRRKLFEAHETYFRHRHEDKTPESHREMVEWFWNDDDRSVLLSYRGSGKSTRSEEFVTLAACYGIFYNCLLIGSSEARAAERLAAISNELKTNDDLRMVFGDLVGQQVWTQTKLVLKSGYCISAMGRDQDIRGIKHLDWRPDLIVVDDFEDKDNVQTPEGRRKTLRWFLSELLPACDPKRKVRVLATPMDAESVPMLLIRKPRPAWPHRVYPIEYLDDAAERQPSWPDRFSLNWIDREKSDYEALGEYDVWEREFMCNAVSDATRVFKPEMIKVEPRVHTFEARWGMIDPARTTKTNSAATGWAVWSWERYRLTVWEAGQKQLRPSEIVDLGFNLCRKYGLVELGFEETGLNLWAADAFRQRQITDGPIPYRGIEAPANKIAFIGGLENVAKMGNLVFVEEFPDLRDALLAFPRGRIDAPNALAYALKLRPGRLIYDGWHANQHIRPLQLGSGPIYLAANATRSMVAGSLVRLDASRIGVLGDWVIEGDPGEATESLLRNVSLACGRAFTVILGPQHFDQWHNVGFAQFLRGYGVEVHTGTEPDRGRAFIRRELERTQGGEPAFAVAPEAHWVLRALSGGYARQLRDGYPVDEAAAGPYRVLMEGLESLAGLVAWGLEDETAQRNWAYDPQGRRYLSAMPVRRPLDA